MGILGCGPLGCGPLGCGPLNCGNSRLWGSIKFPAWNYGGASDLVNRLVKLKKSKNVSKMKNLCYIELKMQEYLELKDMTASQAKALFKFRIRMAPLGENCRGGAKTVLCPLCK